MSTVQISFDGQQYVAFEMSGGVAGQMLKDWETFILSGGEPMFIVYPTSDWLLALNFDRIAWIRAQVKDDEA